MSTEDELAHLRRLNRKLIALLESRGVDWQTELDYVISEQPKPALVSVPATVPVATSATTLTPEQKIALFRKLFRGRADVYPIRWENNAGRSGYSPACHNEWKSGICGKPAIKCSDCRNKSWKSVSDQVIYDHLAGKHVIGVYPLISLSDNNTSKKPIGSGNCGGGGGGGGSQAQVRQTNQTTETTEATEATATSQTTATISTIPAQYTTKKPAGTNASNNKPDKYDHCHFLAVDFDDKDWQADATAFRASCDAMNIPCSIEISRSGNGAHAWIFFSEPVLAKQARNLGSAIISHACSNHQATSYQPALTSYDRMFPNQDSVNKTPQSNTTNQLNGYKSAGFGNLIALPLQKHPRTQGRSVFVDHDFVPYPDQWAYLASIKRLAVPSDGSGITTSGITTSNTPTLRDHIDHLIYQAVGNQDVLDVGHLTLETFDPDTPWKKDPLNPQAPQAPQAPYTSQPHATGREPVTTITLTLANLIYIPKADLTPFLTNRLIRIAAFQNPEYYKAQALGFSVWNKPRIICRADNFPHHIGLPRGCLDAVIELFAQHNIRCDIQDERQLGTPINGKAKDAPRGNIALPTKVSDSLSDNASDGVSDHISRKLTASFIGNLRSDQTKAVHAMLAHDQGVLCAPTAFGKTVTAAALIAERGVNTLIIVHRKELLKQWQERLCTFLDIKPTQIGIVGGQGKKPDKKAMERATERITEQAAEEINQE